MVDPPQKPVLGYASPMPLRAKPASSIGGAIAYGLPGWLCWLVWLSEKLPYHGITGALAIPGRVILNVLGVGMLLVWLFAGLFAFASIFYYRSRQKPWYVIVCLITNIAGLIFTLAVFCGGGRVLL